jgi:cytochrome c-type biogenesis protein CcmH
MSAQPNAHLNSRLKRWPAWVAMVFVIVGLLAIGVTRDTGPRTPDERIVALEKRLACPVCDGESVYESRNTGSVQIRELIQQEVARGELTDQQIIDRIVTAYNGEELLVPTASGIEALAWALPATAFVFGVAGLAFAFRRWQAASRQLGSATDADYALVESALEHERVDDEP